MSHGPASRALRFGLVTLLALLSPRVSATADTSTRAKGIDAYRVLWERNIFDPHRRAVPEFEPPSFVPPPPPERHLRLVGVLIGDEEARAFFEGSDYSLNTTVAEGEYVGEFFVEFVEVDAVELKVDGEVYRLPVGGQMASRGDGWVVLDSAEEWAKPGPDVSAKSAESAAAPRDSEGSMSLIEQLRERRRQELSQ